MCGHIVVTRFVCEGLFMKKKKSSIDYEKVAALLHPPGSAADVAIELPPKRELVRPNPHYFRTILYILLTVGCGFLIYFGAHLLFCSLIEQGKIAATFNVVAISVWIAVGCVCIFLFFVRKRIPIWFVHIYQYHAPEDMRLRCVFTPSCSEYMILAIEKYGVIRGIYKGIKRLKRCHLPNGGEDYP